MSKFSPDEARILYEELTANTDTVGHASCGNASEASLLRLTERTGDVADDYTREEMPASDTEDGPPALRFHVASPWHALIHLSVNNRGWLEGKQGPIRTPLVYRGQRLSKWAVTPSLLRAGTDRAAEERRLHTFRSIVRDVLGRQRAIPLAPELGATEALSDATLEATAQHYGIRTDLLDFTSDEAVAVSFACQGGCKGDTASVFALPLAVGAFCDIGVLMCHPLALRPYRQHGLFLRDPLNQMKRLLIEIRFPIDPEFQIRRDRLPTALYPQEEWWTDVVSATAQATRVPTLDVSRPEVKDAIDESLVHMLQMLMELTTFDVTRNTSFNHEMIALVARQNGQLILACEERCRLLGAAHFRRTMGQFVVPQMLEYLREFALKKPVGLPSIDISSYIDTFMKWLPYYRDSHGGLVRDVPTLAARRMVEICRENHVDIQVYPQGPDVWTLDIKGTRRVG